MNTTPFDDENGSYFVLCNEEGQYSLWPEFIDIPKGWSKSHGPDAKASCLRYVAQNWTDMRPRSLIRQMQAHKAG
jgi:MbtH protein